MHEGMLYNPIQGQGQGHGASESSENCTFQSLSPPPLTEGAGK